MMPMWLTGTCRRVGIAAVYAACLTAVPAKAAPICPIANSPVTVTLTANTGTVAWRTRSTRRNMERLARRLKTGRKDGHPTGLTVAVFRIDMRTSVNILPLGKNRFCAVPVAVDFTIGYPEFIVYIDRRYRRGTCEYHQIRDHEGRHVAIYRDRLRRYAPHVRTRLTQAAERLKPIFVSRQEDAADAVLARLKRQIDPILNKMQRATDDANGRLDTARNYRRIQQRCRNW